MTEALVAGRAAGHPVSTALQPFGPGRRGVVLKANDWRLVGLPDAESGEIVATETPARGLDGLAGVLSGFQRPRQQLQHDLRLGIGPMVPSTESRAPSSAVTTTGESVCGGRRRGPYSAGWPCCSEKPMPRLCTKIPWSSSKSWDPKPAPLDMMRETPVRSRSTTHTHVVPPSLYTSARQLARSRTAAALGPSRSADRRLAPSACSWSTATRSNAACRAASTRMNAHASSSGSPGRPTVSAIHAPDSAR